MTAHFLDFLECGCCRESISQKSKLFWAKKHVRAIILQKASQEQFNTDLLQELNDYHMIKGKIGGRKYIDKPRIHGFTFCWKRCFSFLHGVSYTKMNSFRKDAQQGNERWKHKTKGRTSFRRSKGFHVNEWIKAYKDVFGEFQPTSKKKIELPPDTKANLYIHYLMYVDKKGFKKACYRHFLRVWKEDFPNLILPENCRLVCFISIVLTILFFSGQVQGLWSL